MKAKPFLLFLALAVALALPDAAFAAAPVPRQTTVSRQGLIVDGEPRSAQKYNIDGSNYCKLRDLAMLLNGTGSQFEVDWDAESGTVRIVTGASYTPVGGELRIGTDRSASAAPSAQIILIDGERRDDLYVYNIGGENYFRLRDLGEALGFEVDFDTAGNTAVVTSAGFVPAERKLTVAGRTCFLGMTTEALTELLGSPDTTVPSTAGFAWSLFGTGTYLDFLAAGVYEGKVVALASAGTAFTYLGLRAGVTDLSVDSGCARLYTDKNDGGILHAVLLRDETAPAAFVSSDTALGGESFVNFHMTNAFRVYHGLKPFLWSEAAARTARLHSQDMADRDYFSHRSLDGRTPWERMEAQGIVYGKAAENISAGRSLGIDAYDGWVNSEGHRANMLDDCVCLGVGAGFGADSNYRWYMTQDFFTARDW